MDRQQVVLHMNHGMGDNSYAHNSIIQKKVMREAKGIVEESMMRLYTIIPIHCFKVADLGCSSGPNALQLVSNVIDIVHTTTCNLNLKPPIFQFFLNDLFGNDFNSIFKSLPQFSEIIEEKKGHKCGACFINATPGTFYKSLFPNNFLHFVHSSFSLHWLSQNLIEAIKLECFDLPLYDPTIEEAKEVIEDEGSFTLQRLESVILDWSTNIKEAVDDDNNNKLDLNTKAEFTTKFIRAALEPLLKAKFGEEIMDELFVRYKNKIVQLIMGVKILEFPTLIISLIKKV
ncbi:probable jasmonic acid carboxyl methyltransferase 1 isoform X4 [Arachis stenosperma]|uniref:probable jasmonic acid carboxyl methyltransferase 1 isoform X4 n=1 Tax=Arachis stenosperma TaxID=217475 RepID=UPI0025AD8394|nr:probable jasmonic acid carboxyl methyltransferase 1 isoform X4 [Arachis stenosperma]